MRLLKVRMNMRSALLPHRRPHTHARSPESAAIPKFTDKNVKNVDQGREDKEDFFRAAAIELFY